MKRTAAPVILVAVVLLAVAVIAEAQQQAKGTKDWMAFGTSSFQTFSP